MVLTEQYKILSPLNGKNQQKWNKNSTSHMFDALIPAGWLQYTYTIQTLFFFNTFENRNFKHYNLRIY